MGPVSPEAAAPSALAKVPGLRDTLRALRATGASRWEAVGLVAGALGEAAARSELDRWCHGAPTPYQAVRALDAIAMGAPDVANLWLGRWLERWLDGTVRPGNLNRVGRNWVDLSWRRWVTSLPEGLRFGDSLDLRETGLRALPERLEVAHNLVLADTLISVLPPGVRSGGPMILEGAPLLRLPDGFKAASNLNLRHTLVTTLPDGLEVGGDLWLAGATLQSLPRGLRVVGDLDLRDTPAWDGRIPPDAILSGKILTDACLRGEALEAWRTRTN
jgi:hypothetical protein